MAYNTMMLFGFPGPSELMIVFVIILVLFGGAKLPEMARNIGKGMRVFKEEANSLRKEIDLADQPATATKVASSSKSEPVTTEVTAEKSESN